MSLTVAAFFIIRIFFFQKPGQTPLQIQLETGQGEVLWQKVAVRAESRLHILRQGQPLPAQMSRERFACRQFPNQVIPAAVETALLIRMVHTDLRRLLQVQPQTGEEIRHSGWKSLDRQDKIPASGAVTGDPGQRSDRKSTRLNSSH